MIRNPRRACMRTGNRFGLLVFGSVVVVGLALPGSRIVLGQDDWDAAEKAAQPLPAAAVRLAAPQIQMKDFERWAFGGKSVAEVERLLMTRSTLLLAPVERACELTEAQREKLELAARGDVRRFVCEIDEARESFSALRNDPQKIQQVFQLAQQFQTRINSGFFDEHSLLNKVLKTTLTPEQSREYEQHEQERRRFRYEAKVELALTVLETGVPLNEKQRQQFLKVLLDETEPPKHFGQQAYYEILYQASKVDEEKIKPIFDDAQWRAIRQVLATAEGMLPLLNRNGFTP